MLKKVPKSIKTEHLVLDKNTKLNVSVDMVLINQVLHHLDEDTVRNLIKECLDVLPVGGVILINTSTHDQVAKSLWWTRFFDKNHILRFTNKLEAVNDIIKEFKHTSVIVPDVCQSNYYDYDKVFTPEFRQCDSMWSLLNTVELNIVLNRIKKHKGNHEPSEMSRLKIGQTTTFILEKR
jgi:SAM-dependent methyltransferase